MHKRQSWMDQILLNSWQRLHGQILTLIHRKNVTHASNGAEWYNNGLSFGFAGLGDSIIQGSADIAVTNGHLRLSWHGQIDSSVLADTMRLGYRAGTFINLYGSDWDKIVITTNISPVPLPAAVWLFPSALGGLGFFGWRKRKVGA